MGRGECPALARIEGAMRMGAMALTAVLVAAAGLSVMAAFVAGLAVGARKAAQRYQGLAVAAYHQGLREGEEAGWRRAWGQSPVSRRYTRRDVPEVRL